MTQSEKRRLETKQDAEKYAEPILKFLDAGRVDEIKDSLDKMELQFGKYEGKTLAEVAELDQGYLEWVVCPDELLQRRGIFK